MTTKRDRTYGTLIGGFIGDSLGGRYEFMHNHQQQIELDIKRNEKSFLDILGGGIWRLTPGQITDDSELALTLAQNIIDNGKPDHESLAQYYIEWFNSGPFDIGNSTKNSFSKKNRPEMIQAAKELNDKFQQEYRTNALSNGALMRIAPMCIFCAGYLSRFETISNIHLYKCYSLLKIDTELTHYSDEAHNYCYFFMLLCISGILYGKLDVGLIWIESIKQHLFNTEEPYKILCNATKYDAKLVHDPTVQQGDVRIAYQLAIRKALMCQFSSMTFEEALISTILLGGDSDTNACIVGILCGSIVGSKGIPKLWINRICNARPHRYNQYAPCQHLSNPSELSVKLYEAGNNYSNIQ